MIVVIILKNKQIYRVRFHPNFNQNKKLIVSLNAELQSFVLQ